jgi:acetylornithine/succinyldiaminopimelate/putrescine aminotransferase
MRIAPPLVITDEEIRHAGSVFRAACDDVLHNLS